MRAFSTIVRPLSSTRQLKNSRPQQAYWTSDRQPEPVASGEAVEALRSLCQRPGAPRWAVTAWANALVGTLRDAPRVEERHSASGDTDLVKLIEDLRPAAATVTWPVWMRDSRDEVLLDIGTASGKPGRTVTVDIPYAAEFLTVDIGDDTGLCRFRHPQWNGTALESLGHLQALVELLRHAGGGAENFAAASVLVRWCVGWNRADCGRWARTAVLWESHTGPAAVANRELSGLVVADVLADVLAAAGSR